jgi:hypothetical protein
MKGSRRRWESHGPEVGPDTSYRTGCQAPHGAEGPTHVAHERQRPAGEGLHIVVEWHLGEVHVALLPTGRRGRRSPPGHKGEVVDLPSHIEDGVTQRVVPGCAVGVRDNHLALGCVGAISSVEQCAARRHQPPCGGRVERQIGE